MRQITNKRLEPLYMPSDGRGLLVGQTGTGKSTLAEFLISDKRNLIAVDPKGLFEPRQEYVLETTPEKLPSAYQEAKKREEEEKRFYCVLFRPSIDDLEIERIDLVFQWIFQRGNTFVYLDEITTIVDNPQRYPKYLRAIYTQGRGRGIGILSATQRPSGIPGFFYTESERYWKFFLANKRDYDRMGEFMGESVEEPPDYPLHSAHSSKHSFYFFAQGERIAAREYELDLPDLKIERKG